MKQKRAHKNGRYLLNPRKKGGSKPRIGIGPSSAPIDPAFEESAGRVKEHLAKEIKKRKK